MPRPANTYRAARRNRAKQLRALRFWEAWIYANERAQQIRDRDWWRRRARKAA